MSRIERRSVDLTVSIVSAHKELLQECLQSIYQNTTRISFGILVVDNSCAPGISEMIRSLFPDVKLIRNEVPLSFSANHNQALKRASGRHVLILNDDTIILPQAFDLMVAFLDGHPEAGAVGCKMYADPDRSRVQTTCFKRFPTLTASTLHQLVAFLSLKNRFPKSRVVQACAMEAANHDVVQEAAHLNGACLMVRQAAVDMVGLLDENYCPIGMEETDWCFRLRKAGWKLYYLPEAEIIHYGSQTIGTDAKHYGKFHYKQKCYFLEKHFGRNYALIYKAQYRLLRLLLPQVIHQAAEESIRGSEFLRCRRGNLPNKS